MQNNHCKLTLLSANDFDDMLAMFAEPTSFTYIPRLKNQTREFYLDFLSQTVDRIANGEIYYWAMRHPKTDMFMGAINLNTVANGVDMQIGWQICEGFRHQGFAYLGAQMALDFAINETEITTLYGVFEADNIASERIVNKLRFSLEKISIENDVQIHKYIFQISR